MTGVGGAFPLRIGFLIGAARSGTTLLGERILAHHPEVAYLGEQQLLWRYRAHRRPSDVLEPETLPPGWAEGVRSRIEARAAAAAGRMLIDKTPPNCLRVRALAEVFPEARCVHLIRDGRDVAVSAREEWLGRGGHARDSRAFRESGRLGRLARLIRSGAGAAWEARDVVRLHEWPAVLRPGLDHLRRQALPDAAPPWGPRIPDLARLRREHDLLEVCALQWAVCVQHVLRESARRPERWLTVRYEDLVREPGPVVQRILEFLELGHAPETVARLADAIERRPSPPIPDAEAAEARARVERVAGDTLAAAGYRTPSSSPERPPA